MSEFRHAVRRLVKRPGFSCVVVLTLALGIGANTAIFSAINAVLLRPLPLRHSGRLLMLWESNAEQGTVNGMVSPANLYDWREQVAAFDDVAAYGTGLATIAGEGLPEVVTAAWVTGNFFAVLGVPAVRGRMFRDEETWGDAAPAVVLSDRLWTRRFGRDPSIVGRTVVIDEVPREVVGIVPAAAAFPERGTDVWQPLGWDRGTRQASWFRRERFLRAVARLDADASLEQARAQLEVVVERQRGQYPLANQFMSAGATPLQDFLAAEARRPLFILLGSAGLLFLLTCANVGNLVLVRSTARSREVALRRALGAGRGRILVQALTESALLALGGGVLGAVIGSVGISGLLLLQPPDAWRLTDLPMDLRLLAFGVGLTFLSVALFGLAPALRAAGTDLTGALKEGTRATSDTDARRASRVLVVAEVALAVCLVSGAGLLVRSFFAIRAVDPGFRTEDRLAASVVLPARYDGDAEILGFMDQAVAGLGRLPGVAAVTYTSRLPLSGTNAFATTARVEGGSVEAGGPIGARAVAPNYFQVLGIPLLRGRTFGDADGSGVERVVIINQTLARHLFAGDYPIGRRIAWERASEAPPTWYRIVGVAADERQHGPHTAPQMEAFLPFRQVPSTRANFVLHVPGTRLDADVVRAAIAAADPLLPVYTFQSLDEMYARALGRDRFLLTLLGTFGTLALVLAVLGVYGVTLEAVSRRTREIGIRVALGADARSMVGMILRQSLVLAVVGIAIGTVAALAGDRALGSILHGISPSDPLTFLGVAALVSLASAIACAVPARRASTIDPVEALRHE